MSLVEDSHARTGCGRRPAGTWIPCDQTDGQPGDIGKDSPSLEDALKFLKEVEEKW